MEYSGFLAYRGKISYLIVPTIESHSYISSSAEVAFIPTSLIATFEESMPDDTVLKGYDFDTIISFK
ncbi:hypothetical protein A2230_08500 [candidate division WOR-1 bacterium RIFOXYA2_FULL_36_21]|uniref:Uncharacterized protein n=1 Tax=candidate division WOR-1 bacterium RIFOXYB2_FULL_36_35 TaxID=1802578 RepID=A0A1F4S751_UNCSA|nr:MAG: hypothetical protein A2230_08500 [candidate division WOR-1 bacterium RIFOXYA2_FULL_36_21]OGC16207.1 MAG: hypothetical protein A2290_00285 [candidate division WOR-1 bacterium RIFOXYB2_FULL_36_35]